MTTMLACGHAANAMQGDTPCCAICGDVTPASTPDLAGRLARCTCGATRPSDQFDRLAFFEYRGPGSRFSERCAAVITRGYSTHPCGMQEVAHQPDRTGRDHTYTPSGEGHEFDSYCCGCRGWD